MTITPDASHDATALTGAHVNPQANLEELPIELKLRVLKVLAGPARVLAVLRRVSRGMRDAVDAMIEDQRDTSLAAKFGRLSVLKNLLQRGHLNKAVVCKNAAEGGHLETLKWAREKKCPWNTDTCAYAAKGGHLEALQWARENGCPWGARTCAYAAWGGHLEVLKWARENGCPWSEKTREVAASKGYVGP